MTLCNMQCLFGERGNARAEARARVGNRGARDARTERPKRSPAASLAGGFHLKMCIAGSLLWGEGERLNFTGG